MAIRHLGHGDLVYQPVIFQGVLPKDERSAAALFSLAARCPAPIPKFSATDVRLLAHGGPLGTTLTVAQPRPLARERRPEQDPESPARRFCLGCLGPRCSRCFSTAVAG